MYRPALAFALLAGVALALLGAPRSPSPGPAARADPPAFPARAGPAARPAGSDAARGREAGLRPSRDPRVLALARRFLRGLLLLEAGRGLERARALLAASASPRVLAQLGRGPPRAVAGVDPAAVHLVSLAAYGEVVDAELRGGGDTDAVALTAGRAAPGAGLRVLAFEP